jgi:hypothetical protein
MEKALCALNVYENAAVCGKTESTNPGLNIHLVPKGFTIQQVEAKDCELAAPNKAKKVAKYKLSTSCSYTPSILGYYHVSRILGGVANVPPAVLRTFDLDRHLAIGKDVIGSLKSGSLIQQTWSGLISQLKAGGSGKKKDLLLTDDLDQSYGALQENPTKEEKYSDLFNGGADQPARAANFKAKNPVYLALAKSSDVSKTVGSEFTAANVQKLVAMRDVADMIVIDTIMNQQDRFGNIHYINKYFFRTGDKTKAGLPEIDSDKKLTPEEIKKYGAVQVREMILKDNDCGVTKTPVIKQAKLLQGLRHIDPSTYKRVLKLNAVADSEETRKFFTQGTMMTPTDYSSIRKNLKEVAEHLYGACKQGNLKLDLDLESHFAGQEADQSCEIDG